ncbi:unnamed protein product [Paramecium sonneborni]|uniref:Uncharacterized protein n=1 Tax=Paramecium sonneborni TaxID=65129 RepID=A0A8S1MC28_9CILI|nr:unnamed protein product [Paramecium sonneborni]
MKRRQIQAGSPFDEAQINYAIQVPNQPFQEPVQSNSQINVPTNPKVKELAPIQEIDFREALLQEIDSMQKQETQSTPQVQQQIFQSQEKITPQQTQTTIQQTQQTQSNQQLSRAQQLIQQSQQLIQRRRQPKQQEQQHQIDTNQNQQQFNTSPNYQQPNSNQSVKIEENIQRPQIQTIEQQELQQPKQQQSQQQQQQQQLQEQSQFSQKQNQDLNFQQMVEVPNDQQLKKSIDPPNTQLNDNQNEQIQQNQVQKTRQQIPVPKNKETEQKQNTQIIENVFKEQQPQLQQQKMIINQNNQNQSSVITAQTFYHGLVSYDIQSNQITKLRFGSIASQYPGPYFKNRNPDNLRQLRYFWSSYNPNNALLQLAIDHLERPLEKNSALQIIESKLLNNQSGLAFVEAYERIHNQNDWETKLLVSILEGELINTKQQQSLIEYIKKRSYHDDQEAWLIRLAVLLKMVPIDQDYYSELLIQLQHLYSNEQIQARLLWILLKMEIQNTQLDVFLLSFFTKLNYSLCHSEIQLLLGDSHMCFHNQQNAELYYKLSLLFLESENYDKALECVKFSIDLGYHSKARDLRERILYVIELKEKNKSNTNNNSNGGLLGYFGQAVNAVKNIQKQPQSQQQQSYQPQPQNFYYDKQLKAYVINGVPQIAPPEEEQKKEVIVTAPPPPRRKIDPPKPIVQDEQLTQSTQEITEDPFATQSLTNQSEHNKKKNNLLRNRYVQ